MRYVNDFFYFIIRPDETLSGFIYCSGVNVTKFSPLTKGRHGQGSNPAVRGLQLVRAGIMDMALSKGGKAKKYSGNDCAGLAPTEDTWYTERLLIENVPQAFSEEVIRYSVTNLLKKIANALRLEDRTPDELLDPGELQGFIEKLCNKYGSINEKDSFSII